MWCPIESNRHALSSPYSEAAARCVHRIDLGVSERPAPARARADHANRRGTVDREPEGGPDTALRSGLPTAGVSRPRGPCYPACSLAFQVIDTSEQEYVAGVAFKSGRNGALHARARARNERCRHPAGRRFGVAVRTADSPRTPPGKRQYRCEARCPRGCSARDVDARRGCIRPSSFALAAFDRAPHDDEALRR